MQIKTETQPDCYPDIDNTNTLLKASRADNHSNLMEGFIRK